MKKSLLHTAFALLAAAFVLVQGCDNPLQETIEDDIQKKEPRIVLTFEGSAVAYGEVVVLGYTSINFTEDFTFTIRNEGTSDLNLTGDPRVSVSGTGLSIIAQPASAIIPGGSKNFTLRFAPEEITEYTGTVTIHCNDPQNDVFSFTVRGFGSDSNIVVKQGATEIENGSGPVSFGDIDAGNQGDIEFTIENTGSGELHLTSTPAVSIEGSGAESYSVSVQPDSPVDSGTATNFTLRFSPTESGVKEASVVIPNNDGDDDPYTFTVTGTGIVPNQPSVSGDASTYDMTPEWTWTSGGGSSCSGTFRYKLDNSDLTSGATETTGLSFSPSSPLSYYSHTLYVQERNTYGYWSAYGSYSIYIYPPGAPTVTNATETPGFDTTPTWTWSLGAGGNGTYRYKLDSNDFTSGATVTTDTTYTPASPLTLGNHTLYVQGSNEYSYWSTSGSCSIRIVSVLPSAYIGGGSAGWKTEGSTYNANDSLSFDYPSGFHVDGSGNIYVADYNNNRVCKWNSSGNAVGWIGGGSNGWKTTSGATAADGYQSFNGPTEVFVDGSGYIYVADHNNNRVCKWDASGNAVGWIGGGSNGWKTTNGATAANDYQSFDHPSGIHIDGSGYIYVADRNDNRVCKWNASGNAVGWIGGGTDGWKTTSSSASGSDYRSFTYPYGVFVDSSGSIYVAEYLNYRVCKWNASGSAVGWIGGGTDGWHTTSGSTAGSGYQSLDRPKGVFVDGSGNIYAADSANDRISMWTSGGTAVGWAGLGMSDTGGWGWHTTDTPTAWSMLKGFYFPCDVYLDTSAGYLFVCDTSNNRVCRWSLAP